MPKRYTTTAEWDTYNRWVRHVWDVWAPTAQLPRRLRMATMMGVLWAIVQSGTAGLDCGISDTKIAKIVGCDRATVWEYRRHAHKVGLLQRSVSGLTFGRVKCVDILGTVQDPFAGDVGTVQEPSGRMLEGSNTNNTLIEQHSDEQHSEGMLEGSNIPTCNSLPQATERSEDRQPDDASSQEKTTPVRTSHLAHAKPYGEPTPENRIRCFADHPDCETCRESAEYYAEQDDPWSEVRAMARQALQDAAKAAA